MIYEYLAEYCDKKKITITELERRSKLGHGSIPKWKNNEPSLSSLRKVSIATGISVNTLVRECLKGIENYDSRNVV